MKQRTLGRTTANTASTAKGLECRDESSRGRRKLLTLKYFAVPAVSPYLMAFRTFKFARALLFAAWLGAPAFAAEPDALARIGAQLEQYPVVRSEFVQTKQMAALKRPLVTSGRLVYARQFGVLWQIEAPFRMSYLLGEERIVEIGSDGARRERGMREVPGLAQVGQVFRALLGADAGALQPYFDLAVHGDPGRWEIVLTPRQAQLAQFVKEMRLSGGRFVETISISEAGGDSTQIRLRNTQGASAPSAAELPLFGSIAGSAAKP